MFHRGCSSDVTSTLRSGLIAGGREGKEGHTVLFTLVNLFKNNPDDKNQQRPIEAVKHIITANASLIKTLSTVSTWPEHKKGDCSHGKQGVTPCLFTIKCWPIASKKWYAREETQICMTDSPRLGPLQRWFSTAVGENPRFPLTDNPNPRSFRKSLRSNELLVAEEEHEFKVELRRIPQDAVF